MVKRGLTGLRPGRRRSVAAAMAFVFVATLLGFGSAVPVGATAKFSIGDEVSFSDGSAAPNVQVDLFEASSPFVKGPYVTNTRTNSNGKYSLPADQQCYVVVFIAPDGTSFRSPTAGQQFSEKYVCIEDVSRLDVDEILYRTSTPPPPPKDDPRIDIEKFVNGQDADTPPGPTVDVGSTVRFTYVVRNNGDVPLEQVMVTDNVVGPIDCPLTELAVGASMNCTPTSMTAELGGHSMEACVKGVNDGRQVDDCDPVYWTVPPPPPPPGDPMIDIEKFVNGEDADTPPGPTVDVDSTVQFTYVVRNNGDVPLEQVMVTDNVVGPIDCPLTELAVGASMNCTPTSMTAELGDHSMEACVKGVNDGRRVDDCDPVYWTVPPPPSTEITECTQRRKRGFVVLADKQFPEDGFMPPSSVKTLDGEELIGYAAYGRNPKRGWGLEGDRFIVDKDAGLGAVIITDQRGSYRVDCDIKGSPIGFDLDASGEVTAIDGRFEFDLDANGTVDTLTEWFAPTEGILIDNTIETTEPGVLTGAHLFGDMGGEFTDGFEKLKLRDGNGDGQVDGAELSGLAIWTDANSDARVNAGEVSTLADHGIVALSVEHADLVSFALTADGTTIVTQDLWFTIVPTGAGSNTPQLILLGLAGLGVVGFSIISARRRRDGLDDELTDLVAKVNSQ